MRLRFGFVPWTVSEVFDVRTYCRFLPVHSILVYIDILYRLCISSRWLSRYHPVDMVGASLLLALKFKKYISTLMMMGVQTYSDTAEFIVTDSKNYTILPHALFSAW